MAFEGRGGDKVLATGASSRWCWWAIARGGNAIRNYIQNGGGDKLVSHAIRAARPTICVWSLKGFARPMNQPAPGPFLTAPTRPKTPLATKSSARCSWLTIRSDNNDKFAQPDGCGSAWPASQTGVTGGCGPELRGAPPMW